jgi:hypothetical protein
MRTWEALRECPEFHNTESTPTVPWGQHPDEFRGSGAWVRRAFSSIPRSIQGRLPIALQYLRVENLVYYSFGVTNLCNT